MVPDTCDMQSSTLLSLSAIGMKPLPLIWPRNALRVSTITLPFLMPPRSSCGLYSLWKNLSNLTTSPLNFPVTLFFRVSAKDALFGVPFCFTNPLVLHGEDFLIFTVKPILLYRLVIDVQVPVLDLPNEEQLPIVPEINGPVENELNNQYV